LTFTPTYTVTNTPTPTQSLTLSPTLQTLYLPLVINSIYLTSEPDYLHQFQYPSGKAGTNSFLHNN
jgi:hypothetical protein